ncbi:unnamed protein product [Orchesella dallaii]|uniref:Meiosis-specific nuclear structural protein 1 n=1 Tax=Orchesella dallaii TaxID=48710 RepID=A0ABP1RDQ9_9HEXA
MPRKSEHTLQLQQVEQERQKWEREMVLMQADIRRQELEVENIDDEKREVAARRFRSAQRKYAEMYVGKQRERNDTLIEQRKAE